jgi:protein phosphatase
MHLLCHSEKGLRDEQQDCAFALTRHVRGIPLHVAGVADGVGSAKRGDIASRIVCQLLAFYLGALKPDANANTFERAFRRALAKTSEVLADSAPESSTTATAAFITPCKILVASVGDSPCLYHHVGKTCVVTREHTTAQDLYAQGEIEQDAINHHPFRSMLTSYVSREHHHANRVHTREIPLHDTDRVLLCTDGLINILTPAELNDALQEPCIADTLHALAAYAAERADDNASFVLAGTDSRRAVQAPTIHDFQTAKG